MPQRRIERVEWAGPAGRLVGLLHCPELPGRAMAVVSHPHPLFGGTMDNKVVYRMARAIEESGALVLRYNFRGVAGSEGTHDGGRGEQDDLRGAMAFLRARGAAGLPLLLAGFSFGAAMSARVGASDPLVAGILLVGTPVGSTSFDVLRACDGPVAFVQGSADEHGPLGALRDLYDGLTCPKSLRVVEGAGHFFDAQQQELHDAVRSVLDSGLFGAAFAQV